MHIMTGRRSDRAENGRIRTDMTGITAMPTGQLPISVWMRSGLAAAAGHAKRQSVFRPFSVRQSAEMTGPFMKRMERFCPCRPCTRSPLWQQMRRHRLHQRDLMRRNVSDVSGTHRFEAAQEGITTTAFISLLFLHSAEITEFTDSFFRLI